MCQRSGADGDPRHRDPEDRREPTDSPMVSQLLRNSPPAMLLGWHKPRTGGSWSASKDNDSGNSQPDMRGTLGTSEPPGVPQARMAPRPTGQLPVSGPGCPPDWLCSRARRTRSIHLETEEAERQPGESVPPEEMVEPTNRDALAVAGIRTLDFRDFRTLDFRDCSRPTAWSPLQGAQQVRRQEGRGFLRQTLADGCGIVVGAQDRGRREVGATKAGHEGGCAFAAA